MLLRNTDTGSRPRTWNTLVNAETRTTLELAPGESADVLEWRTGGTGTPVLEEPSPDSVFPFLERVARSRSKSPAAAEPAGADPSQPAEE